MTNEWEDLGLQPLLEDLMNKDFDYLQAVQEADMYRIMNPLVNMFNLDKKLIAKAVYEIGNYEGALEVIENYLQEDFETIEECIVWAKRYD